MSLSDYRQQFPQYNDIPDDQLAGALYKKYGAPLTETEFYNRIGYQAAPEQIQTPTDVSTQGLARFGPQPLLEQPEAITQKTVKLGGRGLLEGVTTELPKMLGDALQFAGRYNPQNMKEALRHVTESTQTAGTKKKLDWFQPATQPTAISSTGKILSSWADKKAKQWYGEEPKNLNWLDKSVYEGSKMLAPSAIPAGTIGAGARVLLGVGNTVKAAKAAQLAGKAVEAAKLIEEADRAAGLAVSAASAGTAAIFGLSQAQQTREAAYARADELEKQGDIIGRMAAEALREKADGIAPLATGTIEATGEYFGTKYLSKLFGLSESEVVQKGAANLIKDFLKTLGVEVGTEVGQQYGEATVEKYTAIRPEAQPLVEALDVIGPTAFMTILTGGAGAVSRKAMGTEQETPEIQGKPTEKAEKPEAQPITETGPQVTDEAKAKEAAGRLREAMQAGTVDYQTAKEFRNRVPDNTPLAVAYDEVLNEFEPPAKRKPKGPRPAAPKEAPVTETDQQILDREVAKQADVIDQEAAIKGERLGPKERAQVREYFGKENLTPVQKLNVKPEIPNNLENKSVEELKTSRAKLENLKVRYQETGQEDQVPRVDEALKTIDKLIEEKQSASTIYRNEGQVLRGEESKVKKAQEAPPERQGEKETVRRGTEKSGENFQRQSSKQPGGAEQLEPKAKEPWEMTYDDLRQALSIGNKKELEQARPILKELFPEYNAKLDPWGIYRAISKGDEIPRVPFTDLSKKHRQNIKQAIESGENVPANVLAEYPDLKPEKPNVRSEKKYFTLKKAQDLYQKDFSKVSDSQLQKDYVKLRDYIRFIESQDKYSKQKLIEGGYYKGVADAGGVEGMVPADMWLHSNLKTALDEATKERKKRTEQPKEAKPKPLTKKQKSLQEYNDLVSSLTDEQKQKAGDLIVDNPESPSLQARKIRKAISETKAAAKKSKSKPQTSVKTNISKPGQLEDFGEKIGGARKDISTFATRELSDDDIANQTLTQIWPKSQVDSIEDNDLAAIATTIRGEIPTKPQKGYKLRRWVQQVKGVRELMRFAEEMGPDKLLEMASQKSGLSGFVSKVKVLQQIDRNDWSRVQKVEEHPNAYSYDEKGNKFSSPFVNAKIDNRNHQFKAKSVSEVMDQIKDKLKGKEPQKRMKFEVRGRPGKYQINKTGDPLYRPLKTFKDLAEAREYQKNNYDALKLAWEQLKERENVKETDVRSKENRPRVGADYRNGKDATPDMFMETFGFRGVEFGNWVSQGKNIKERQGMLNAAYDALNDLADILGVPTKALSLNGELGLGLGSRGHGWASAHYEPDYIVINLTKTRGAGAIAHEFFHALDHYFHRTNRGKTNLAYGDYITYQPETYYEHTNGQKLSATRFNQLKERNGLNPAEWKRLDDKLRSEVSEAFKELVDAINASPMSKRSALIDKGKSGGYWSRIIERAARSFENYIIAKMQQKGYHNDYLANVVNIKQFSRDPGRYPYLLEEELPPIEKAFDNLFATLQTKETDKGTALFSLEKTQPKGTQAKDIESLLKPVVDSWAYGPDLVVVQSQDQLPKAIKDAAYSRNPNAKIKGAFLGTKVYLTTDNFDSVQAAGKTLVHESFGHLGIKGVLGRKGRAIFRDIYRSKKSEIQDIAKLYNFDLNTAEGRDKSVEEWLARQAETAPKDRFVDRVMAAIRNFLRKIGLNVDFSDAEIRQLLVKAREHVMYGKQKTKLFGIPELQISEKAAAEPQFSLSEDEKDKAQKWFEDFEKQYVEPEKIKTHEAKFIRQDGTFDIAKYFRKTGIKPNGTVDPHDLTKAVNWLQVMSDLVKNHPEMQNVFDAQIQRIAESNRDSIRDHDLTLPYFTLKKSSRKSVNEALLEGDAKGEIYDDQNLKDKFGLTDDEIAGYNAVRNVLEEKLRMLVHNMLQAAVPKDEIVTQGMIDSVLSAKTKEDLIDSMKKVHGIETPFLSWLFDWVNERKGYIPHKWKSEWVVWVNFGDNDPIKKLYGIENDKWMLEVKTLRGKLFPTRAMRRHQAEESAYRMLMEKFALSQEDLQKLVDDGKVKTIKTRRLPVDLFEGTRVDIVESLAETAAENAWTKFTEGMSTAQKTDLEKFKQLFNNEVEELYLGKGWGQHLIARKGIKGYRTDLDNVISEYLYGFNAFIAKGRAAKNFAKALKGIDPKKTPRMWDYSKEYIEDMLGSTSEAGWFKKIAGTYFLAADLSAAALNMTQNWTHAVPLIKSISPRTGKITAERDIARAMNDVAKEWKRNIGKGKRLFSEASKNISQDEINALQEAYRMGYLDPAMFGEVTGLHSNKIWQNYVKSIHLALYKLFTGVEGWNRMSTFLASYRRALRADMSHEDAVKKAVDVVNSAHFVYGRGNRPKFIRRLGAVGNIGYTFMTYPIQNITFLKHRVEDVLNAVHKGDKQAVKSSLKVIGTNLAYVFAFGGLIGLPFAYLWQPILNLFTGGEDDWEVEMRKRLPKFAGRLVTRGVPAALLGNDMSWRVQGTDAIGMPIGFQIGQMLWRRGQNAWKLWGQGEDLEALAQLLPDLARNPIRAYIGFTEGGTRQGVPPVKYTPYEAITKALGFTPTREAEAFKAKEVVTTRKKARMAKLDDFAERYLLAKKRKNFTDMRALRQDVIKYNKRQRETGGPILKWSDVKASAKRRKTSRAKGFGEEQPKYMRKYQRQVQESLGLQ